jgi:hypothetical protein
MLKSLTLLSLAAAFTLANAQAPDPAPQAASDQSQPPAPIVRSYQQRHPWRQPDQIVESQPTPGVWLRSESTSALTTVSATPQRTEIRLDHGRLNVNIHQPAQHSEILIDLPGGQTSLLKDGLYTFNADTNTVRVLRGEAAYVGKENSPATASANTKPIKIKEDHQISLVAAPGIAELKSVEAYPYELTADLLPPDNHGEPDYPRYAGDYPPYAPYPYYAGFYGYPYGYYPGFYGYPFAYGIGFGYYGGFGYHGGFRR